MRWAFACLFGLLCAPAAAEPVCNPSEATFGKLGSNRCAPVDGKIAERVTRTTTRIPCGDGRYSETGAYRIGDDGKPRPHRGSDILAAIDTDVHAVAKGKIDLIATFKTSGLQVNILHEDQNLSRYFHLSAASVATGDQVVAGGKIGTSGDSGNAAGWCPHVHLEVKSGTVDAKGIVSVGLGQTMDPLAWLADGDADVSSSATTGGKSSGTQEPKATPAIAPSGVVAVAQPRKTGTGE